jgi:ATP-dependent helicase/nuclease subunit B
MELEKRKSPDKQIIPAGVLYSAAIDPIIDKQKYGDDTEGALLDELKPQGFIQSDEQVISHLDKTMEQKSQVVPVSRNKDGSLKSSNELLTAEEFSLVSDYVEYQVQRIGKEILQGNAQIAPHQIGQETGCMFCEYKDICGINEKTFGHRYRELENLKKDEALEIIREEVDAWE